VKDLVSKANDFIADKYKTVAVLRSTLGMIELTPNPVSTKYGKIDGCLVVAFDDVKNYNGIVSPDLTGAGNRSEEVLKSQSFY